MSQGRLSILIEELVSKKAAGIAAERAASSENVTTDTPNKPIAGQMPGGFPGAEIDEPVVSPVSEVKAPESASDSDLSPQEVGGVFGWIKKKLNLQPKESPRKESKAVMGAPAEVLKSAEDVFQAIVDVENDGYDVINRITEAKRFGFDINLQQNADGDNALHVAVKRRGLMIVDPLLQQAGIEVDARNAHGESALLLALTLDDADSASLLLDAGAKDYRSSRETLLGVAVGNDGLATVNMLLKRGMRADEYLLGGRSALEIAEAMIEQNVLRNGEAILRALYADSDRMAAELNKAMQDGNTELVTDLLAAGVPVVRFSDENMQHWVLHLDNTERAECMAAWSQTSKPGEHPDIVMMVEKMKRLQAMRSSHVKLKKDMVTALEALKNDIIDELAVEMKQIEKLGKDVSDVHDSTPVLLAIQTSELLDKLMAVKDAAMSDADFQKNQQAALKYYEDCIPDMPRRRKLLKAVGVVLLAIGAFILTGGILFGVTVAAPVVIPMATMIGVAAGAGVFTSVISGTFFMRSPAMRRHAEAVATKSAKFVDERAKVATTA